MSDFRDESRTPGPDLRAVRLLTQLVDTDRDDLLADIVSIATFVETLTSARTGAKKRKLAIQFVRAKWTELNTNVIPDFLEDWAIGAVVDLFVAGLNAGGVLDAREVKVGIDARSLGREVWRARPV